MIREVTIYNYDLNQARKSHYENVINDLKSSGFKKTFYRINHGDKTIKFWSYSMNEWRGLTEELNKPY